MTGIALVLLGIFIFFWCMVLVNSVMIDFNRTLDDAFQSMNDDEESRPR